MDPLYFLFGLGLAGFAVYMLYQMRNKGPVETGDKVIAVANGQELSSVPMLPYVKAKHLNQQGDEAEARRRLNELLLGLENQKAQAGTIAETAKANHQLVLDTIKHEQDLLQQATVRRMSLEDYKEFRKRLAFDEADLEKEEQLAAIKIKGGLIYKYFQEHQNIQLVRNEILSLYQEVWLIENSNVDAALKQRKIALIEEEIKAKEQDKREREKRLLQAHNGQSAGGSNQAPQP